jgi:Leucine-rich repeat (LRR) protein
VTYAIIRCSLLIASGTKSGRSNNEVEVNSEGSRLDDMKATKATWVVLATAVALSLSRSNALSSHPSCNPLVCLCSEDLTSSANCTGKGFLTMPTGLPETLQKLDLSHNDLEAVNVTELARLKDLIVLDLSHNLLPGMAAIVHYQMKVLDLSHNNISSVGFLHLEGLLSLEVLLLAHNRILNLPPNSFAGSPLLKSLDLRSNKIVSLEPGCLDQLSTLEELVLTKNKLSSIPKGLFEHMKNLHTLELNKNRFVEIESLSFNGLDNLRVLKLKRNQIEYLDAGAFYGLSNIKEIHLDRNSVKIVDKAWLYGLTTLRFLSLAHNRVDYIEGDGWEFCHALADLDLSFNRIQLLDRGSLRMLPRLQRLYLQDNLISHIEDDNTFAEVPMLEVLALDGNEISYTIEDMNAPFRGLSNLRKLGLSRNLIKSVGGSAFEGGLGSLEEIDLRANVISTVQENAFARLSHLLSVRMNSSSMLCDCYLKWLPRWINETGVQGCENAMCAHPESLKATSIMRVPYDAYTCDDFPKPYILQQPQTQITLKGSNLTLYCRAASTSPADMTFEWKMDSRVAEYGPCDPEDSRDRCIHNVAHSFDGKGREITSELRLSNLEYDDAGLYQCVVANQYGATYSDRANITVYVYPQFVVTPEDITVQGGQTAALKCAASGVPAPKVSWSKDSGSDFPAAAERRINVNSFAAGNDQRTNVNSFVIYSVKAKDMGVYQCLASNPAGKISWNITLSVLEVPRRVTCCQI